MSIYKVISRCFIERAVNFGNRHLVTSCMGYREIFEKPDDIMHGLRMKNRSMTLHLFKKNVNAEL